MNLFDLTGKTAIVTGTRTGLGKGIAEGLAMAGADILGVSRKSSAETKQAVERCGRRFIEMEIDLTDTSNVQVVMDRAVQEFGRVDILVNNAGIIRRNDALDFSEKDWDDVMNVNLKSLFFLSQAVAQNMVDHGIGGKIINIASMLSYQGGIRVASYTSSKSGVMGLTKLLANEWAKYNINVNAIAPGYMVTDNTEALRKDDVRYNEILGRIPAGRWGTPEDLVGTAIFLSSDASKYIQGHTIAVDGGWLAR